MESQCVMAPALSTWNGSAEARRQELPRAESLGAHRLLLVAEEDLQCEHNAVDSAKDCNNPERNNPQRLHGSKRDRCPAIPVLIGILNNTAHGSAATHDGTCKQLVCASNQEGSCQKHALPLAPSERGMCASVQVYRPHTDSQGAEPGTCSESSKCACF